MTTKINFPKAGMGIEEGTVVRWMKAVGDKVTLGEPLVEMETAKAVQEIVAPASGLLVEILLQEGESGTVNSTIGVIEEDRG